MPAAKKTKKATSGSKSLKSESSTFESEMTASEISSRPSVLSPSNTMLKRALVLVVIVGLIALVYYKKNWFIAATVNGSPVSNFELLSRLNKQFRTQMLNQMVNEKIILDEARKNNLSVSEDEINQKIAEYEENVGGAEVFDSLLSQQGQTRDSIKQEVKIQLTVEKMYSNEATVSAEEVSKFIEENKAQLQASDSAGQTKEATDALKQQKLQDLFRTKFQQLKDSAKITIY